MIAFCKHFWSLSAPLLATAHLTRFSNPNLTGAELVTVVRRQPVTQINAGILLVSGFLAYKYMVVLAQVTTVTHAVIWRQFLVLKICLF